MGSCFLAKMNHFQICVQLHIVSLLTDEFLKDVSVILLCVLS